MQASTATIYSHRYDAPNDEADGILGGSEPDAPAAWRFSVEVAKAWEEAAQSSNATNTRLVLMRSSIVLNPDRGSAFDKVGLSRGPTPNLPNPVQPGEHRSDSLERRVSRKLGAHPNVTAVDKHLVVGHAGVAHPELHLTPKIAFEANVPWTRSVA